MMINKNKINPKIEINFKAPNFRFKAHKNF